MSGHAFVVAGVAGTVGTVAGAAVGVLADVAPGANPYVVLATSVIVALIGAVPSSLVAFGALRAANRSNENSAKAADHAEKAEAKATEAVAQVDNGGSSALMPQLLEAKDAVLAASVEAAAAKGQLAGEQIARDRAATPELPGMSTPVPVVIAQVDPSAAPVPVVITEVDPTAAPLPVVDKANTEARQARDGKRERKS